MGDPAAQFTYRTNDESFHSHSPQRSASPRGTHFPSSPPPLPRKPDSQRVVLFPPSIPEVPKKPEAHRIVHFPAAIPPPQFHFPTPVPINQPGGRGHSPDPKGYNPGGFNFNHFVSSQETNSPTRPFMPMPMPMRPAMVQTSFSQGYQMPERIPEQPEPQSSVYNEIHRPSNSHFKPTKNFSNGPNRLKPSGGKLLTLNQNSPENEPPVASPQVASPIKTPVPTGLGPSVQQGLSEATLPDSGVSESPPEPKTSPTPSFRKHLSRPSLPNVLDSTWQEKSQFRPLHTSRYSFSHGPSQRLPTSLVSAPAFNIFMNRSRNLRT